MIIFLLAAEDLESVSLKAAGYGCAQILDERASREEAWQLGTA